MIRRVLSFFCIRDTVFELLHAVIVYGAVLCCRNLLYIEYVVRVRKIGIHAVFSKRDVLLPYMQKRGHCIVQCILQYMQGFQTV
jgi:hypothetical protein